MSGIEDAVLYVATGSCGTHSGILAGLIALGNPFPLQGVSVSRPADLQTAKVFDLTTATLRYLGLPPQVDPERIRVDDRFVGSGYGRPTPECMGAIETLALDEGILLDPVYTAKAMAGLFEHARSGQIAPDTTVVFVHTGGAPALFAYNHEVVGALEAGA
jgi:1-aminocyclopropane-1-carboxylate deaminase/D-cysteine desulfhydrase-like pyridoxal-dependent ACC family enzyme